MQTEILLGILIPFLGTALGAGGVFFMRQELSRSLQAGLTGFAAGVMVAASFGSLIVPSIRQAAAMGRWAFVPAVTGVWVGMGMLRLLDTCIPVLKTRANAENGKSPRTKTAAMALAVTLHNIPEGMAVGVAYAGYRSGNAQMTAMGAMALSLGIAVQNFPEGAIISMPLCAVGMKKRKAFVYGVLSGIVEPLGAALTLLMVGLVIPALPYLLSFVAGAMLYVVAEELLPELMHSGTPRRNLCFAALGFAGMLFLDVLLG